MEEVNVNKDGTGLLSVTANLSQSKGQLEKLLTQDSILNYKIPGTSDIEYSISGLEKKLSSMEGISNVTISKDFNNYIFILKCNFQNVTALNNAINSIWASYDKKAVISTHYYYENSTFKKLFDPALIKNHSTNLSNKEKEILGEAVYTMIFRFNSEIISYSNSSALLSKSRKALILKSPIYPVIAGSKDINNSIKIK